MKIVNFGSCNIDHVYKLEHIVVAGETVHSREAETFPGGKGLNQSIATARAGAKVYHAGCIGNDGELLQNVLSGSGVDLRYLKIVDCACGHAVIQVDDRGENAIFIFTGANGCFSIPYIDSTLDNFERGDILLLQNEINNNDYIIERASEKGMFIILNPSPINDAIKNIDLNKISCLVMNEIEGEALSGQKQPSKIISYFQKNYPGMKTVLTLGDKGCFYYDGEQTIYQSAYDVDVVDSTAAGDTFTGYFVAALSMGLPSRKIIERSCAAAAIAVSRAGAAPSIPTKDEVDEILLKLTPKESETERSAKVTKELINAYIEANLQSANLEGLSKKLGYSAVYTGAVVKKTTGATFSRYLLEKRCFAAAKMLEGTDRPVGEIVERVGYSNQSYFREAFREIFGVCPAAYRQMMTQKGKDK